MFVKCLARCEERGGYGVITCMVQHSVSPASLNVKYLTTNLPIFVVQLVKITLNIDQIYQACSRVGILNKNYTIYMTNAFPTPTPPA